MEFTASDVVLGSTGVTADDVVAVARRGARVSVSETARVAVARSAAIVEGLAAGDAAVYGISTGFGSLATTVIPPERREELQRALIRSHAAGMGPLVETEVVRAMMLLRARTLAMGFSGVRQVVIDTILALLNADVIPAVHEHGSLGASGDLAPLATVALALIGEGECAEAMAAAGVAPVTLRAKEGLALINGTDGMLGMLVLALADLDMLVRTADIAAAMSVEALMATDRAFAADLMVLRPHHGQTMSADNLRRLLVDSQIVASHRTDDPRVQDAYSLRCTPQVHGAARDTITFARSVADTELRSAIDNPSVLPDGRVESCGHFHGAPVGFACDFLAIAAAVVGAIAERRTERLLDRTRSHGLPLTTPKRRWSPRTDAWRRRPASTRCRRRRCRRTTCRWGGVRRASCAPRWPISAGSSRASWCAQRAASICVDRCSPPSRRRPRWPRCARRGWLGQDPTGGYHRSSVAPRRW